MVLKLSLEIRILQSVENFGTGDMKKSSDAVFDQLYFSLNWALNSNIELTLANGQNSWSYLCTLPTAEILNGKNARAWVSMVLYLKNK